MGIQLYTSLITLTRSTFVVRGGTTLETRGKFQGAYRLFVGHRTVHLVCGMNQQRGCLSAQAWDTCRDVASLVTELETRQAAIGNLVLTSRLGRDTGITRHPFIHEYQTFQA